MSGRVGLDPFRYGRIISTSCDKGFKVLRSDPCESKKELVERAIEVIVARSASDHRSAFVERASSDDVATDGCTRAAWECITKIERGDVGCCHDG